MKGGVDGAKREGRVGPVDRKSHRTIDGSDHDGSDLDVLMSCIDGNKVLVGVASRFGGEYGFIMLVRYLIVQCLLDWRSCRVIGWG